MNRAALTYNTQAHKKIYRILFCFVLVHRSILSLLCLSTAVVSTVAHLQGKVSLGNVYQARFIVRKVFHGWGLAVVQTRFKQQQCLQAKKHSDWHLLHKVRS